ncbi:hypothetical protein ACFFRR_008082 [Megaselia abdita]
MLECPICMKLFDNENTNVTTNCGHVLHLECLNDWYQQDPGKSCPTCRAPTNGMSTKIYLQFDSVHEVNLESLKTECDLLRTKVSDSRNKRDNEKQELEFQIDILETQNRELSEEKEMKIAEIASFKSLLDHEKELKAKVEFLLDIEREKSNELSKEIFMWTKSLELYEKNLEEKKLELVRIRKEYADLITNYQKHICLNNVKSAAGFLSDILKEIDGSILKQNNSNVSSKQNVERKKKIVKEDKHKDDIDYLVNQILQINPRNVLKERNNDVISVPQRFHKNGYKNGSKDLLNLSLSSNQSSFKYSESLTSKSPRNLKPKRERDCVENKCVVKGIYFEDIQISAVEYILALAMHSNFRIRSEDIQSAEIQQHALGENDLCSIFVVFKDFDIKTQFLNLQGLPRNIRIMEALDKQTYALFRRTESLYNFGYSFIYHQGGNIFVKRNQYTDPIPIRCVQDIANLKRK